MDLLKKYILNIQYLIRNENCEEIKILDRLHDFEDEPKKIVWVFPDSVYQRGEGFDFDKRSEYEKEQIIQNANKKELNLTIIRKKFKDDKIIGYCFRLTNMDQKRRNQDNSEQLKVMFDNERQFNYDITRLNYIRSILVKEKTQLISKPGEYYLGDSKRMFSKK
jgi:hypothetical protein